jgi:hypothetical protein
MAERIEVALPGGYERDGAWQRAVWLRPWCGRDEAWMAEEGGDGRSAAALSTALLARCLALDGGATPATPEFARALTVGDREALLLHLRRLTLGERLACVLHCPACGERLDLELRASDLLLPAYGREGREVEATVEAGAEVFHVRFRLPTGADQEAGGPLVAGDPERAERLVLERCVLEVLAGDGRRIDELPRAVGRRLAGVMAELDPQAELRLEADCPGCGAAFATLFDAGRYLQEEVARVGERLFHEVHTLASHYHWSEAEILAMTVRQRRRYLDLLSTAASGGGR